MEIFLRSAWNDIQKYVDDHFDPLGVIELINLFPGNGNWEFKFTRQWDGQFRLNLYVTGNLDWENNLPNLLCGSKPHLFCCSEIQIKFGNAVLSSNHHGDLFQHRSQSNSLHISKICEWTEGQPHLSLIGFGKGILHPELSNPKMVEEFFRSNTWAGNRQFRTSNNTFGWKILASDILTIKPLALPEFYGQPELIREYEQSGVRMTIAFHPSYRSGCFRIEGANFSRELMDLPIGIDPIRKSLSKVNVGPPQEYSLILESTDHLMLNGMGAIDFSKEFLAIYESFDEQIRVDLKLKEYFDEKITEKTEHETRKLNERKLIAQSDSTVRVGERPLLTEPKSELGVVSLFSKLEALDMLPFEHFSLREITPDGHGIDALADFQLHANEHRRILAPLEFEFKFVNFVSHGHEKPQVELIVCWELGTNMPANYGLEETEYPWLFRLSSPPSSTISVVVLKEITEITLS